jgi:hypothetical protein
MHGKELLIQLEPGKFNLPAAPQVTRIIAASRAFEKAQAVCSELLVTGVAPDNRNHLLDVEPGTCGRGSVYNRLEGEAEGIRIHGGKVPDAQGEREDAGGTLAFHLNKGGPQAGFRYAELMHEAKG